MMKRISLGGGAAIYVETQPLHTPARNNAGQPRQASTAPLDEEATRCAETRPPGPDTTFAAPEQQTLFAATRESYGD